MIAGWYDDDWVEDLESWEELAELLRGDWDRMTHPALGLSLERADGLLAFDLRGRWRARHRRGLHRLGFRAVPLGGMDVWKWDAESAVRDADLTQSGSPFVLDREPTAVGAAIVQRLRRALARDRLVREQALRVTREVFRCEPGELGVLLVREDDEWGDEDDDVWPPPGG